ncbi:MAG: ArsR family transcriptional regulator, partial [Rhodanobacter sp.]
YYAPVIEAMNDLIGYLTDHCCSQTDGSCGVTAASCKSKAATTKPQRKVRTV